VEKNPYKFTGALDPEKDRAVCVTRQDDVKQVIHRAIMWGDYWAVIGPRQVGKTTFLRQVQQNCPDAYFVFFDFNFCPKTESEFYPWLKDKLIEEIPAEPQIKDRKESGAGPVLDFLDFLAQFKPTVPGGKKIIFLFDEIELIPNLSDFFGMWRKVHTDRFSKSQLARYGAIVTGSVDLIKETAGKVSAFNIAHTLYLKDFLKDESRGLIEEPLKTLEITIQEEAKDKLILQTGGHPQLLQHACHKLVNTAYKKKKRITVKDVDDTIDYLLKDNANISNLWHQVKKDTCLKDLILRILKGEKIEYLRHTDYSISEAGPIVEDVDRCCAIRNPIYKKFLRDILDVFPQVKPKVLICFYRRDEKWLKQFFNIPDFADYQVSLFEWQEKMTKNFTECYHELQANIEEAFMTIFVLSDHPLTPDFFLREEIFELIRQQEKAGKYIFKLVVPGASLSIAPFPVEKGDKK